MTDLSTKVPQLVISISVKETEGIVQIRSQNMLSIGQKEISLREDIRHIQESALPENLTSLQFCTLKIRHLHSDSKVINLRQRIRIQPGLLN